MVTNDLINSQNSEAEKNALPENNATAMENKTSSVPEVADNGVGVSTKVENQSSTTQITQDQPAVEANAAATADEKKETAADIILRRLSEKRSQTAVLSSSEIAAEANLKVSAEVFLPEEEVEDQEEIAHPDSLETIQIEDHAEKEVSAETFAALSKKELVSKLKEILNSKSIQEITNEVEVIKTNFYKKHNAEIAEVRKKFIDDGGDAEEFKPEADPTELELKELYKGFKQKKTEFNEQLEKQKTDNLKAKYQIIEEIKELVNGNESLNKTFHDFRDLQKRWREIGLVPQNDVKSLWETYHHYVEKFYDFVNINKELRDLDLRKNLEVKVKLCEKAEELLLESSILKAFKALQKLHAQWREVGPVPREKKDEIWERFKEATTKINKLYQAHFENIKEEQDKNLKAKTLLCEKSEEISEGVVAVHKDWDARSKEIIELQKIWKLIGFAPKKDNNRIYNRFRQACDKFFNAKREFYSQYKEEQNNNLQMKTDLCIQAEGLKDSDEWKKTTDIFINLQKRWKDIGPVPRKHSDAIWKRFRAACNQFFENKNKYYSELDNQQEDNLKAKLALIEKVESFEFSDNKSESLEKLKEIQKEWTEIGHVPFKSKDEIQKKFRDLINARFDKIRQQGDQQNEERFKNKIESLANSPKSYGKLKVEREKLALKLKQVESDIVLLENNIGFFAKSKNAESVIYDVKHKIEKAKELAEELKEKLRLMDDIASK